MKKSLFSTITLILALGLAAVSSAQTNSATQKMQNNKEVITDTTATGPVVEIQTDLGNIKVRLYDDTPVHRDNFLKLVDDGSYNGVLFHRVIKDFMVQTGDLNSKDPNNTIPLGAGDTGYTLPAEINYPRHFHKYGALAAARTGDEVNPERRSSGSQFYIVTGKIYSPGTMKQMEERMLIDRKKSYFTNLVRENMAEIRRLQAASDTIGLEDLQKKLIERTEHNVLPEAIPTEVIDAYGKSGGTPHLDGSYTVFGEVLEGMDVVEKIQHTPTNSSDVPLNQVVITAVRKLNE